MRQFSVVLNSIICVFVRFCDKITTSVKDAFSGLFFRKQKGTRVFH